MKTRYDGSIPGPWNFNDIKHEPTKMLINSAPDLLARLKAMYELVKGIEGVCPSEEYDYFICPECMETHVVNKNRHKPDCTLAAELRLTEQLLGINQTEVKP